MKRFSKFIPMAALALGLLGALSSFTVNDNAKETVDIQGYVQLNEMGTECDISIKCSDDGAQLCTVGATQVFGKLSVNAPCTWELRRNH
jgi:hypothetical protein